MQAIVTKYLPATNFKGSRVRATCQAKTRIYSWDNALNITQNHVQAAKALASELGWNYGEWVGGELPQGNGSVFVCKGKYGDDECFTVELSEAA